MKTSNIAKQHSVSKKWVAFLVAIPLTLSLTTAAFAASPGQSNVNGTGIKTRLAAATQSREANASDASRVRPYTRLQQTVQNRVESSDLEELRLVRQEMMESGDWERFKEDLEDLQELRESSQTKWKTINGMNQEIRTLTQTVRKTLLSLPAENKAGSVLADAPARPLFASQIEDRAEALQNFRAAVTLEKEAVEKVREQIRDLQILKNADWYDFKEALLAGDLDKADIALSQILSSKTDIIRLQETLVMEKQSMIDTLNAFITTD